MSVMIPPELAFALTVQVMTEKTMAAQSMTDKVFTMSFFMLIILSFPGGAGLSCLIEHKKDVSADDKHYNIRRLSFQQKLRRKAILREDNFGAAAKT
jgi:hypothetical protein